jgi:anti-sigma B factor antagonist
VALAQPEPTTSEMVITDGLLEIRRSAAAETCLIQLAGELDLANSDSLERTIRAVEKERPSAIVLDLGELTFIDSTGIQLLVQAACRAEANGHRLGMTGVSGQVGRVFRLSGMGSALPVLDSENGKP